MDIAVNKQIHLHQRVAEQQARATIKNNAVLALIELITNCDDSYRRLENKNIKNSGKIIIELIRKRQGSVVRVIDYAEGFNEFKMDERVAEYGGDTSEFTEEQAGRGYWGRGLKEAMIAFGYGTVESVIEQSYNKCILEHLNYKRYIPCKVTKQMRKDIGIESNGTCITLKALNSQIRIPQYDNLKRQLEHYYSLRDIMSSKMREVVLIEKNGREKIKRQEELSYILPKGKLYEHTELTVPGYNAAKIDLELYRSDEPLSSYDDEGPLRESGILVKSKGAVLDITLTKKFEGNIYAVRLYGRAVVDYIDHLLRVEQRPIIRSDRQGIDWTDNFSKALDQIISKEVEKFVKDEEKLAKESENKLESEKTRKRFQSALPELNKIAKLELEDTKGEGTGGSEGTINEPPPNGFDFVPDYSQLVVDCQATLTLKVIVPLKLPPGATIKINSDNNNVIVINPKIVLNEKGADESGIVTTQIHVIGKQVGAEGVITAIANNLQAEALVKVISKRKTPEPTDKKKAGLFREITFSPIADPRQRVRFEQSSGQVIIATKAPSVEMYFGPQGENQEEGHCQVMLAELVVEAVCREIAKRKIESGEPFLGEASAAVSVQHNRLVNQYGHKIHKFLVEKKFQR